MFLPSSFLRSIVPFESVKSVDFACDWLHHRCLAGPPRAHSSSSQPRSHVQNWVSRKEHGMRRFFPVFTVALAALFLFAGMSAKRGEQFGRDDRDDDESRFEVVEATIPQLQKALEDHVLTSKKVVRIYLER